MNLRYQQPARRFVPLYPAGVLDVLPAPLSGKAAYLRAAWPCRPVSSQAHRAAIPPQSSPVCFSNQRDPKTPHRRPSLRPLERFPVTALAASRDEPQDGSASGIAARLLLGYDVAQRTTDFNLFGRGWRVTKKELAKAISEELGITSVVALQAVQRVFDGIVETLVQEGRIELRNFGVFEVRKRKPRKARNPRTGESVKVPAKLVVAFTPGREMKERVGRLKEIPGADQ